MANDLVNIPWLFFIFKVVELNSSSNHMHGGGDLVSTAMGSGQDPVLVNDGSSTEVCGTKSSDIDSMFVIDSYKKVYPTQ